MKIVRLCITVVVVALVVAYFEGAFVQKSAMTDKANETSFSSTSSTDSSSTQTIRDYQQARAILWNSLYAKGGKTLYCGQPFVANQRSGLNVEHVFPMSWVTNALDCGTRKQCRARDNTFNLIEADLHNLYPSRSDVNQQRSSFAFAEIKGEARQFGANCDFEVSERLRLAEPAPQVRGDVARTMFYMAYRYKEHGLQLFSKQVKLLQRWHQLDPPNREEQRRNQLIADIQGNRNVFIDDPDKLTSLIEQQYFR